MQRNDGRSVHHPIGSYLFELKESLAWGRTRKWGLVGWSARDCKISVTLDKPAGHFRPGPLIQVEFEKTGGMKFREFTVEMKDKTGRVLAIAKRTDDSLAIETPEGQVLMHLKPHIGPETSRGEDQESIGCPFVFAVGARFWDLSVWEGDGDKPARGIAARIP